MNFEINLILLIKLLFYMTRKSKQKLKYLENEKSFQDEIKSIFHNFLRAFIEANEANFFERWESDFKSAIKDVKMVLPSHAKYYFGNFKRRFLRVS